MNPSKSSNSERNTTDSVQWSLPALLTGALCVFCSSGLFEFSFLKSTDFIFQTALHARLSNTVEGGVYNHATTKPEKGGAVSSRSPGLAFSSHATRAWERGKELEDDFEEYCSH